MRSLSIVVFVISVGTLLAIVALLVWRHRQGAVVPRRARQRPKERTLFETTYQQVGVSPPTPSTKPEDATACLAYEQIGLEPAPNSEATALVSMDALLSGPGPAGPASTQIRDRRGPNS